MKFDTEMQNRVATAVKNIENVSSMEVVVTLSPRSVHATVPVLASSLATCIIIISLYPVFFAASSPLGIATDTIVFAAIVAILVGTLPPLQRLLVSGESMRNAATASAHDEFVRHAIHGTMSRTGLLVYISVFERQVLLVPDVGVKALIPAEDMCELERDASAIFADADSNASLNLFLDHLKQVAGRFMPRRDDDINELADELHSHEII